MTKSEILLCSCSRVILGITRVGLLSPGGMQPVQRLEGELSWEESVTAEIGSCLGLILRWPVM